MEENRVNAESVATDLLAWDEAVALEITGDNPDLARELVQMLVQGLPQNLFTIFKSSSDFDPEEKR